MCEAAGRVGTRSVQRGFLVPVNSLHFNNRLLDNVASIVHLFSYFSSYFFSGDITSTAAVESKAEFRITYHKSLFKSFTSIESNRPRFAPIGPNQVPFIKAVKLTYDLESAQSLQ